MNQPFLQNRKPHGFTFLKLGIALIVLLLFSALILSYFYVNVRNQNEALLKQVQETQKKLDQLQISLAQRDLKKAFTDLAQAQKNIAALLPQTREPAQKHLHRVKAKGQQQEQVGHVVVPAEPVPPQEYRVNHAQPVNDYGQQETMPISEPIHSDRLSRRRARAAAISR